MQLQTGRSEPVGTTTVQAPQSPSAQPSFVPVSRRSSRSQASTVRVPRLAGSETDSPPLRKNSRLERIVL